MMYVLMFIIGLLLVFVLRFISDKEIQQTIKNILEIYKADQKFKRLATEIKQNNYKITNLTRRQCILYNEFNKLKQMVIKDEKTE